MVKAVKIEIHRGSVSADFIGFQGRACTDLEERIRMEGLEVSDHQLKPEHSKRNSVVNTETEQY